MINKRYSRQVIFREIGERGQERIGASRVAIIGCGALGSNSAEMLVRAGTGKVTIVDRDFVEKHNLQRQALFTEADAEQKIPKAIAAREALRRINSTIEINGIVDDITFENIGILCRDHDLIVDGTDNFETRFLINDFSVREKMPWIYGAVLGSYGIGFPVLPDSTPCLRCIFPKMPPSGSVETCETAGIIGPVIHAITAFQVTIALQVMTGTEVPRKILHIDLWKGQWRSVQMGAARPDCRCCQKKSFDFLSGDSQSLTTRLCGRNAIQIRPAERSSIDLEKLADHLEKNMTVLLTPYLLRVQDDSNELILFSDGRAIIKGTDEPTEARSIYSRIVGL